MVAGEENSRGSLVDLVARFPICVVDHDNTIIKCEVFIGYPCKGAWGRLNMKGKKKQKKVAQLSVDTECKDSPAIRCVWPST